MFSLPVLQVFSNMVAPVASAQTRELSGGIMTPEGGAPIPAERPDDPGTAIARDMAAKIEATYQGTAGVPVPTVRPTPDDADLEVYNQWKAGSDELTAHLEGLEGVGVEVSTPSFSTESFNNAVAQFMESDHGDIPSPTKDASEAELPEAERSKDVGYGHKVTSVEEASGMIHGIPFKDEAGNYISLTAEQKADILEADLANQARIARSGSDGWDADLESKGSSWDELDEPYKAALTSLAFNVGGGKGRTWSKVLKAAIDRDIPAFAAELRRQDNKKNTAGMDNRVMKELYYAGLIQSRSEVADKLPLANDLSGIPE